MMMVVKVAGATDAVAAAKRLVHQAIPFHFEPLPDDLYSFALKPGSAGVISDLAVKVKPYTVVLSTDDGRCDRRNEAVRVEAISPGEAVLWALAEVWECDVGKAKQRFEQESGYFIHGVFAGHLENLVRGGL